jgi:hypothetical protein
METIDPVVEATATTFPVELGAKSFIPLATLATYGAVHAGRDVRNLARSIRERRSEARRQAEFFAKHAPAK